MSAWLTVAEMDDLDRLVLSRTELLALSLEVGPEVSLDRSPKHNWVEDSGGLPNYIRRIALHLIAKGMSMSHAIATAISQCKKWAAGGEGVHPDTMAKASAAIALWEKLKATAHVKHAAKDVGKLVSASAPGLATALLERIDPLL